VTAIGVVSSPSQKGSREGLSNHNPRQPPRWQFMIREVSTFVWLVPGFAMMIALFIVPVALIFRDGLIDPTPTLRNYAAMAHDPLYVKVLWNSIRAAVMATIGCLIIGYPAAYGIFRANSQWRHMMLGAVLFSFAVGTVPRTFSWLVVLGDRGLVNRLYFLISGTRTPIPLLYNQVGVFIGMLHVMLPYIILILLGSMMRVSPHLVPAARTLGAPPHRAFFAIFLPLTLPGIVAGAMLVFVYSLGFYLVPAVLGGASQTTVVMEIENLTMQLGIWGMGSALSSIVILLSVLGAALYVRVTGLSDISRRD
jgi:putative spermidine/putrescine transport system permease protein